ncbi:PKD domain-containing protein [Halorussus gelatinilyticus]|uniref:PKD domain-containing protein n=1 Tax=Halorussus gelatinilyticus TaxID=2937524 RepID=A0A8U0IH18_9EURY|nr:PKD domain-containing protein [Halorussus gelatinilyticus]UPW00390.1 PKD domain-containing protein [Halorussus gelatinilyticus]
MRRTVLAAAFAALLVAAPMVGSVGASAASPEAANAPGPSERWSQTVGGGDDDKLATGLRVDGGYLAVGWSNSSTDGAHDGYVAMLDRAGETKWERSYGGSGVDRIFDVERVEDGYLLAGMSAEESGGAWDGWLLKIGPDGEKRWSKTYGEAGPDEFWSLAKSGDRIYVSGFSDERGNAEAWAMELTEGGDTVWSETYDTQRANTDEYVNSIFVTDGGDLLMTGTTTSDRVDPADAWVLKVNGDGDREWSKTYGGEEYDRIHDATVASDGGFVLAGRTASKGAGQQDGWMLKITGDGETAWDRTFGTERGDAFYGIHNDPDGGYVLSGTEHVLGDEGADGWIVKTDAAGKRDWSRTYGDSYWDKFWPVVEGHDGGYLAVGESTSYGESRDGWVVRIGGPAVAAIEDAAANQTGTTVTFEESPVQAVTLADSNVSGVLAVAERTDATDLSPPGDALYAVEMDGPATLANGSATVEFAVRKSAVEAELSDVRVAERTDEGWSLLATSVVSEANGTATLSADVTGTGTLAVTSVPAPSATIDAKTAVPVGESVELSASGSTAENGSVAAYEWSVGDRSATGETATLSFDSPGERTVNLTVTDEHGLRDTATKMLVVNDRPEVAVRTPDSVTVGKAGSFSANVSDDVGDVTVTWKFGDGEVTGKSVEHSFGSPGTRTVTVVVEDEYGATVTKEVQVEVAAQDEPATTEATETADADGGVPGFGAGVTLVALLAAALVAVRLRD